MFYTLFGICFFSHWHFALIFKFHLPLILPKNYFSLYFWRLLKKNISLNNFTKVFLFIGSSLFIVMVFINLFTLEVPHYFTNLFSIAKGFILIGLLSLVLENILPKDNHIKLYQKIIFFVALVIFYSQFQLYDALLPFLPLPQDVINHYSASDYFLFKIAIGSSISLILITLLTFFSNLLEKIIHDKYDMIFLLSGIVCYIVWLIITYKHNLSFTPSPYFEINPYYFLEGIANLFFLIVLIKSFIFNRELTTLKEQRS